MRQLIALLCLLMGACASTGRYTGEAAGKVTAWRTVALASASLDVATTLIAQRSGAREQNPVLSQQPQRIIAISVALLSAIWWLSRDLPPDQKARIWKWVAALHCSAALWNGSQLKR